MKEVKFEFSTELKADLANNAKQWDALLFAACLEGKRAECKAKLFAETLRKSGFRVGTGVARAGYKAVRETGTLEAMVAAVTAVKSNRKRVKPADGSLEGALLAAAKAAKGGNLVVCETWLAKAQALLDAIKADKADKPKGKGKVDKADKPKGKGKVAS